MKSGLPYLVRTRRLTLRCWTPADAPLVRSAIDRSDAHLRPWIPFMRDEPRSPEATTQWLASHRAHFDLGEYFRFAVLESVSNELVGENMLLTRVGPNAMEIGYLTFLGHERKGFAMEATCAMVRLAFEWFGMSRVEIHCAPENVGSVAIPKRLGFIHEATLGERIQDTDGQARDLMIWTLFARHYPDCVAAASELQAWDGLENRLI